MFKCVCVCISFIITSADNGWCSCFKQFQITSCSRRVCFYSGFTFALVFFSLFFLFSSPFFAFILFINVFYFDSIKVKMRKSRNFFFGVPLHTNHFEEKVIFFSLDDAVVVVTATSQEHHLLYFTRELQIQNKK